MRKIQRDKMKKIAEAALFPVILIYLEIVLSCSTRGSFFGGSGLYIILFSGVYGLICYLLCSLVKKEKANRIITAVILFVLCFLFNLIYLLFCEFQMFYDLNTMLSGAADAVGGFTGDIVSILFTFSGFLHAILFFLPFFLFLANMIKKKKILKMQVISWKKRGVLCGAALLLFLLAYGMVALSEQVKENYKKEGNFDATVREFGLFTGLRLEVRNMLSGGGESSFEFVDDALPVMSGNVYLIGGGTGSSMTMGGGAGIDPDEPTEEELEPAPEAVIVIPEGKNEMDIDFLALAEKDGGAYRDLDEYVASLQASSKNQYTGMFAGKNLIFLTAEAFTAEVIDEERTPTLYRMANNGIQFLDHYQPASAGTTGGEFVNLFGMFAPFGGKSMKMTENNLNWTTIASRLSEEGYYGKAYHNSDYTYYDRHKTHINLGYSDGYMGKGNGMEEFLSPGWPPSDLEMLECTFPEYASLQPFNIYYMTVSGHSLYGQYSNAMARKNWDAVKDLPYSEPVRAYLGAQMELENAMAYLLEELERLDMANDTVIVISSDHFPYGLDQEAGSLAYLSELYGNPIESNLYRDHNRLIIWCGCLEENDPIIVDTPTTTADILPTLCNLFGVEFDSRLLPGRDVFSDAEPIAYTSGYEWKTPLGTYTSRRGFVPASEDVEIPEGYVKRINAIVKNKILYSKGVVQRDYFRHVFGE